MKGSKKNIIPTHRVSIFRSGSLEMEFDAAIDAEDIFSYDRIYGLKSGTIDHNTFVSIGDRIHILTKSWADFYDVLDVDFYAKEGIAIYAEDSECRTVNTYIKYLMSGEDPFVNFLKHGEDKYFDFLGQSVKSLLDGLGEPPEIEGYKNYQDFFYVLVGDLASAGELEKNKILLLKAAFEHLSTDKIKFRKKIKGQYWNGDKQVGIIVSNLYKEDDGVECVYRCDVVEDITQVSYSVDFIDVNFRKNALLSVMHSISDKLIGEYKDEDGEWADSLF